MGEKSDIQKLKDFIGKNQFSEFIFRSEDQPGHDFGDPMIIDISFGEIRINEYPAIVMLKSECGNIVIDRIVRATTKYSKELGIGEISLVSKPGGLSDRSQTYKIQAKNFL